MSFLNLKIGVRLGLCFSIIVCVFIAVALYQINTMDVLSEGRRTSALRGERALIVSNIARRMEGMCPIVSDALVNRNLAESKSKFAAAKQQALQDMSDLGAMAEDDDERASAEQFSSYYKQYMAVFEDEMLPVLEREESVLQYTKDALLMKEIAIRVWELYGAFSSGVLALDAEALNADMERLEKIVNSDSAQVVSMAKGEWEREAAAIFKEQLVLYIKVFKEEVLPWVAIVGSTDSTKLNQAFAKAETHRKEVITALNDLNIALEIAQEEVAEREQQLLAMDAKIDQLRNAALAPLLDLTNAIMQRNEEAMIQQQKLREESRRNSLLYSGIGAFIAAVLAILVLISITRPLKKGTQFAQRIAAGDMDIELDVNRKDEVGQICNALGDIADTLKELTAEFDHVVRSIEVGDLTNRGTSDHFHGEFRQILQGANKIADVLVGYIDIMPYPVMVLTPKFDIIYLNKAGTDVLNKDVSEVQGRKCYELFKTGDCETERCACARALKSGGIETSETIAAPFGERIDIKYSGIPIFDRHGEQAGIFELIVDQSEVKKAQRIMQDMAQEADRIARTLSNATDGIATQVGRSRDGAVYQRERIEETAAAVEEMSMTAQNVTANATSAATNARESREKALAGNTLVDDVVESVESVNQNALALKTSMDELSVQAESIGQVLNVINDIADQTNLLALNAAIEAARAGEAGRGFAVVADEVRKLAEKTMTATSEVGDAISAIQTVARKNVAAADESLSIVGKSTDLAKTAGEMLSDILETSASTSDEISAIASASQEQNATVDQIAQLSNDINRISNETAEYMDESNQSINELTQLVQDLGKLTNKMQSA